MFPSLFLSRTAITLLTSGFCASSKIFEVVTDFEPTRDVEKLFGRQCAILVFVNLVEVFVELLQLLLRD